MPSVCTRRLILMDDSAANTRPPGQDRPQQPVEPQAPVAPYAYGYGYNVPEPRQYAPRSFKLFFLPVAILLLVTVAALLALQAPEELEKFLLIGVQIAPLAILAALAYGGTRNIVAEVFTYIWLAMVGFALLFVFFAFAITPFLNTSASGLR